MRAAGGISLSAPPVTFPSCPSSPDSCLPAQHLSAARSSARRCRSLPAVPGDAGTGPAALRSHPIAAAPRLPIRGHDRNVKGVCSSRALQLLSRSVNIRKLFALTELLRTGYIICESWVSLWVFSGVYEIRPYTPRLVFRRAVVRNFEKSRGRFHIFLQVICWKKRMKNGLKHPFRCGHGRCFPVCVDLPSVVTCFVNSVTSFKSLLFKSTLFLAF